MMPNTHCPAYLAGEVGGSVGLTSAIHRNDVFSVLDLSDRPRAAAEGVRVFRPAGHGRRARAVGLYWGLRSFAFCPAPLVAGFLWSVVGPDVTFLLGGAIGLAGTSWYAFTASRGC